jgi:1,4-dihydroxy-2-naphthoate octaprenyltransferase
MSIVLFVFGCLIGAGVVLLSGPAGIKTFAMLLGAKVSSILYRIYMVLPFICIIVSVCVGWLHPLALICLIAAVPA